MRAFLDVQDIYIYINNLRRGDCNCHDDACCCECGELTLTLADNKATIHSIGKLCREDVEKTPPHR